MRKGDYVRYVHNPVIAGNIYGFNNPLGTYRKSMYISVADGGAHYFDKLEDFIALTVFENTQKVQVNYEGRKLRL